MLETKMAAILESKMAAISIFISTYLGYTGAVRNIIVAAKNGCHVRFYFYISWLANLL